MPIDLPLQAALLLTPLASELVVEVAANLAVELVDVPGINAFIEPSVFGMEAQNRVVMLPPLIGESVVRIFETSWTF